MDELIRSLGQVFPKALQADVLAITPQSRAKNDCHLQMSRGSSEQDLFLIHRWRQCRKNQPAPSWLAQFQLAVLVKLPAFRLSDEAQCEQFFCLSGMWERYV